jgi:hypothetical protein
MARRPYIACCIVQPPGLVSVPIHLMRPRVPLRRLLTAHMAYPCISTGLLTGVSTSWAASSPCSSVWLSGGGRKAYGRTLAFLPSSGAPSISALAGPLPILGPAAATRDRRRLRRKRLAPARSRTTTIQPMTMPAMAPPERPLWDVDGAMKTVVVGAGEVDVCIAEDEDEV